MSSEDDIVEADDAPATAVSEEEHYDYDASFQAKIAALMLRDQVFVKRTEGLIKPSYLENETDAFLVTVVQDFYTKYRKAPDIGTLTTVLKSHYSAKKISPAMQADVKARLRLALSTRISDRDFVIDQVADFAKRSAVQDAIMRAVDLQAKGDYATIEKVMRQALDVGANEDDASRYDYVKELESRTAYRKALLEGKVKPNGITTGVPDLDKHLYHNGWGRCELTALMGRAKFGKSMGLGTFGSNAWLAGYNTLIVTCETSAGIYADRLDAKLSETAMDLLKQKPTVVRGLVDAQIARTGAKLMIHDYPTGSLKPSQLRRLVERYRENEGVIFDLIVVDYADIMCPENRSKEPREDSKHIWIDLRALAQRENAAVLTATQTNRDGAKATVAMATDVAEDYNKIRTADLVISGNANEAEIKAGKARLHFAASRNQKEMTLEIQQDRNSMNFLKKVLGVIS